MNYKAVLVGQTKVGKTAIALKFIQEDNSNPLPTVGVDILTKTMNVNGEEVDIAIWDTAGAEEYSSLAPMYYRDSAIAIIVYAVDDLSSFDAVTQWQQEISQQNLSAVIAIVGNKSDLDETERKVSFEDGNQLAEELGVDFFETSALTGSGVSDLFNTLVGKAISKKGPPSSVVVPIKQPEPEQRKKCC